MDNTEAMFMVCQCGVSFSYILLNFKSYHEREAMEVFSESLLHNYKILKLNSAVKSMVKTETTYIQ
jgi:hypothetical protein